jgi:chromosomal replication initiation ATPase DnaA
MDFTEDMIRAALGESYTYIHTDTRNKYEDEDEAEVITQTRSDVSPTITYKQYRAQYTPLLKAVASAHGVEPQHIASTSRNKHVVMARAQFLWELRNRTGMSYPWIGDATDLCHTSVIHLCRKFEQAIGQYTEQVSKVARACP